MKQVLKEIFCNFFNIFWAIAFALMPFIMHNPIFWWSLLIFLLLIITSIKFESNPNHWVYQLWLILIFGTIAFCYFIHISTPIFVVLTPMWIHLLLRKHNP